MAEETIESLQAKIRSLNATIDGLKEEVSTAREEAKTYRQGKAELKRQLDAATEQVTTLTGERDELKTKLSDAPNAFKAENEKLKGELRTRDHKDAFKRLAKKANVYEDAIDDLWDLSKYQPDTDEVDEAKLTGLIGDLTKTRPRFVQSADATSGTAEPPAGGKSIVTPPSERGPGAGRGGNDQPASKTAAQIIQDRAAKSGLTLDAGRF